MHGLIHSEKRTAGENTALGKTGGKGLGQSKQCLSAEAWEPVYFQFKLDTALRAERDRRAAIRLKGRSTCPLARMRDAKKHPVS